MFECDSQGKFISLPLLLQGDRTRITLCVLQVKSMEHDKILLPLQTSYRLRIVD
ncbi:hypothetical protein BDQ94DRAFT_147363 [Aspergillus welwitschiae]|uniref:Uncharacterized protein n=1 Tax=Aspergillus welwitschiae TaxID=1341132 RepID=A0A3F3PYH3_9EURO|nr:hypothetical protein BDQ94DRAFT_147363 [Aspergillus welwitschiae]RDH31406.1 hypothetical protein BDQ94DRAFT_147363 [Aspergillus welwitschiae]